MQLFMAGLRKIGRSQLPSSIIKLVGKQNCAKKLSSNPLRVVSCAVHGASGPNSSTSGAAAQAKQGTPFLDNLTQRGLYNRDLIKSVKGADVRQLEVVQDGEAVEITWEDGHVSRFLAIWLRHSCHCEECKLDHNGMIKMDFRQIDEDVRVTSARLEGDKVVVFKWESDSGEKFHEGPIPTAWLRQYCYSEKADTQRTQQRAMKFHAEKTIPEVEFEDVMKTDKGLYKWLTELSDRGICLIKNVPQEDGMVGKVAERIAPLQHTIYGETFDVRSTPQPINAAYSPVKLDLHMDQVHYESPPGLQLLHCITFDPEIVGGDNTFGDIHEVAHNLRKERPDLFDVLTRVPIPFQTIHYDREVPVHMHCERPLFTVNHKNELVSVLWHPMLLGPLQVPEEDVKLFYKAYKYFFSMVADWPHLYKLRMVAGDLISFNNRRVLHGRAAFWNQKTERHLQGTYVEITEFQSQVQVFHNLLGEGRAATRCGSFSFY